MNKAFIFFLLIASFQPDTFRQQQKQFSRVRTAYLEKEKKFEILLEKHAIQCNQLRIYLRAFKAEDIIEV